MGKSRVGDGPAADESYEDAQSDERRCSVHKTTLLPRVLYRYGCTIVLHGERALWYPGHRPAWLMCLLMLWPARYVEAQ